MKKEYFAKKNAFIFLKGISNKIGEQKIMANRLVFELPARFGRYQRAAFSSCRQQLDINGVYK